MQDDFTIEDYLSYECFLRNHSFNVELSLEALHSALKAAQKWDTLCLIDLHKKTIDPFRLFHEYSSISSLKTGMQHALAFLFQLLFIFVIFL